MTTYSTGQILRHLLMRVSMGVTLGWFGFLQVIGPESWIDFIPYHISQFSPIPATSLIFLHGVMLLLSAIGLTFGIYFRGSAWLGISLLVEIIVALVLDHGSVNLIIRDIGLLGLGIGLAFDKTRFWSLDNFMSRFRLIKATETYSSRYA